MRPRWRRRPLWPACRPTYFGAQFRQTVGCTYVEYLTAAGWIAPRMAAAAGRFGH